MANMVKIGETIGQRTNAWGESKIKWYACDDMWGMTLFSGGKKVGEVLFYSFEQMVRIKETLGEKFRIVPKGWYKGSPALKG